MRILGVLTACMIPLAALGQAPSDSKYRLVATIGAGASYYTATPGTPSWLPTDVSRFGTGFTARVMWRPDHMLSVGLESGWTKLYSYETSGPDQGKVFLSQVPLYVVWSMRFFDALNVTGGYGYSRLTTNFDYAGNVNIGTWSMGWLAACSYEHPLSDKLALAGELKWITPVESHDAVVTLQVQLVYDFFEW